MLVLSRTVNETVDLSISGVHLGTVMVRRVNGDRVVLGFDFPETVTVDRHEVTVRKETKQETPA